MKKLLKLTMSLIMVTSLVGCGASKSSSAAENVMSTDHVSIDGVYVNNGYENDDGYKLLYLFYTYTPSTNDQVDSKDTKIKFGDGNEYTSEHLSGTCDYVPNYYYSSYLEDVLSGNEFKIVETFKINPNDLEDESVTVTLSSTEFSDDESEIYFKVSNIQQMDSVEEIAELADPDGYKEETSKRETADDATVSKVRKQMVGYYWSFYVNSTSYEIEFISNSDYELRTSINTSYGKWTVCNGYIKLDNDLTVLYAPYTFENGELSITFTDAYDVKG